MAIYKVDNEFVISSNRVWRPGVYDSEKTAKYAFRFTDKELSSFGNKPITFKDLKELKENINGNV